MASASLGIDTLGFFVTDGGVLGKDLSAIVIPAGFGGTACLVSFNASLGSRVSWTYVLPMSANQHVTLGPNAVYISSGAIYLALNKSTGALLWRANFTLLDRRGGARMLGYAPRDSMLGYVPAGQRNRKLQSTQTRTVTKSSAATATSTGSFNSVVNNVYCGSENLLFPPIITSSGLIIQSTLRCVVGINSTTGKLAWYRISGSGPNYNINVGAFGSVSFTSLLVLSEDEDVFCGGLSSGYAYCASAADGSLIWTSKVTRSSGGLVGPPMIHNNTLFFYANSNNAAAITGTGGKFFVFAYTLSGTHLWNISLTSLSNNNLGASFSVLPAFVAPSVDALVISTQLPASIAVFVINPANATVLRTTLVPGSSGGLSSVIAVDAMNALYFMYADPTDYKQRLYRINATTGSVSYGVEVGTETQAMQFPSYLTLVIGSGAVLMTDASGGVYVYR